MITNLRMELFEALVLRSRDWSPPITAHLHDGGGVRVPARPAPRHAPALVPATHQSRAGGAHSLTYHTHEIW